MRDSCKPFVSLASSAGVAATCETKHTVENLGFDAFNGGEISLEYNIIVIGALPSLPLYAVREELFAAHLPSSPHDSSTNARKRRHVEDAEEPTTRARRTFSMIYTRCTGISLSQTKHSILSRAIWNTLMTSGAWTPLRRFLTSIYQAAGLLTRASSEKNMRLSMTLGLHSRSQYQGAVMCGHPGIGAHFFLICVFDF